MSKKKTGTGRFLILPDGKKREITDETGKYWVCGKTQFRKAHGWTVIEKQAEKKEREEDADE